MIRLISKVFVFVLVFVSVACEKPIAADNGMPSGEKVVSGNVTIVYPTDGIQKMNVMLFKPDGSRAFSQVKTQKASDEGFGTMGLDVETGTYMLICVGHSSDISASIKSPENVQFTAQDGRKLTDTFCYVGSMVVDDSPVYHECVLQRATAMVRLVITDNVPEGVVRFSFNYTGGSANVNPTTLQGITKSRQSEVRMVDEPLEVYTFPYLSETGTLHLTVAAIDSDGSTVVKKTFADVPVSRGSVTTVSTEFFSDVSSSFGFTVGEWQNMNEL